MYHYVLYSKKFLVMTAVVYKSNFVIICARGGVRTTKIFQHRGAPLHYIMKCNLYQNPNNKSHKFILYIKVHLWVSI